MNSEEIRQAYERDEELEYHCMGMEQGASLLSGPGWYPCLVDEIYPNGNVEISLTGEHEGLSVTVLKRNIPIAFRRRVTP